MRHEICEDIAWGSLPTTRRLRCLILVSYASRKVAWRARLSIAGVYLKGVRENGVWVFSKGLYNEEKQDLSMMLCDMLM
jgi:hypothetical protein